MIEVWCFFRNGSDMNKEFEAAHFKFTWTFHHEWITFSLFVISCVMALHPWQHSLKQMLIKKSWNSSKTLKPESRRACWKNTFFFFYWKRVLSLEKDFQKWVSSDLHCCMKVLHFRSVALAFSFFACTSFLPVLRSVPIFFPPHSSNFILLPV